MISNPPRILQTLDERLHAAIELHLYRRAALALGYPGSAAACHATMDVDAILLSAHLAALDANRDFWTAQQQTNAFLDDSGLYFTHLFEETQVILTPDWIKSRVPIEIPLRYLHRFRPATADLILTKMMRIDPQDREDVQFLLRQADLNPARLISAD